MEIDARIVFQNHTPSTSGTANGMIPGILVCDMRTMGDVLAGLAGDTTPHALHNNVIDACDTLDMEWPDYEFCMEWVA